jgi:hypothetical protein
MMARESVGAWDSEAKISNMNPLDSQCPHWGECLAIKVIIRNAAETSSGIVLTERLDRSRILR